MKDLDRGWNEVMSRDAIAEIVQLGTKDVQKETEEGRAACVVSF